jgi:hypothetical protein
MSNKQQQIASVTCQFYSAKTMLADKQICLDLRIPQFGAPPKALLLIPWQLLSINGKNGMIGRTGMQKGPLHSYLNLGK